jgi:hypothetical protein
MRSLTAALALRVSHGAHALHIPAVPAPHCDRLHLSHDARPLVRPTGQGFDPESLLPGRVRLIVDNPLAQSAFAFGGKLLGDQLTARNPVRSLVNGRGR